MAFAAGAGVPLPPGAVGVRDPVRVRAPGRAEPRLQFLYLQSQTCVGTRAGRPAIPPAPRGTRRGRRRGTGLLPPDGKVPAGAVPSRSAGPRATAPEGRTCPFQREARPSRPPVPNGRSPCASLPGARVLGVCAHSTWQPRHVPSVSGQGQELSRHLNNPPHRGVAPGTGPPLTAESIWSRRRGHTRDLLLTRPDRLSAAEGACHAEGGREWHRHTWHTGSAPSRQPTPQPAGSQPRTVRLRLHRRAARGQNRPAPHLCDGPACSPTT